LCIAVNNFVFNIRHFDTNCPPTSGNSLSDLQFRYCLTRIIHRLLKISQTNAIKAQGDKQYLLEINTPKFECALKLSSRIYFVTKTLKYASIPADFDASYLHKANFMNKAG